MGVCYFFLWMEITKFELLLDFKQVGLGSPDRFNHYILWINYQNNKQQQQ